jgi:hypothetical protein
MSGGLVARVDGVALPEEEARALWRRFSAWMEEHRGDLAGFAAQEGFASVHPSVEDGRPVLLASHSARQQPYAPVGGGKSNSGDKRPPKPGGSGGPRAAQAADRPPLKKPRKRRR